MYESILLKISYRYKREKKLLSRKGIANGMPAERYAGAAPQGNPNNKTSCNKYTNI
jgi:hypothetical protein